MLLEIRTGKFLSLFLLPQRLHLTLFIHPYPIQHKLKILNLYYIWTNCYCCCSSVAQSCPTLPPHGPQHARLPCPSPTPGAYSNSCPSSWWTSNHLILSRPLLLLPSIFPSIRVFPNESAFCIRWPMYWWSFTITEHQVAYDYNRAQKKEERIFLPVKDSANEMPWILGLLHSSWLPFPL